MEFVLSATKELNTYTVRLAAPESEFSQKFVQGMANRMAVSFHKYGYAADATTIDCLASLEQRIEKYRATGNTEWLMDAANFAMMEFERHPEAFVATDSDQSPGRVRVNGSVDAARNEATS